MVVVVVVVVVSIEGGKGGIQDAFRQQLAVRS